MSKRMSSNVMVRDRIWTISASCTRSIRAGFTLIELLVVVALVALLLSILMPSLRTARDQSQAVHCGAQMRGLGGGLASYAAEFNDWIPGTNTSGVAVRELANPAGASALDDPFLPVQSLDWMTPLIRYETSLPYGRAEKWQLLFQRYRCVAHRPYNAVPFLNRNCPSPDASRFTDLTWSPVSYLMPASFQFWGAGYQDTVLGSELSPSSMFSPPVNAVLYPDWWTVTLPEGYQSRMDRIGTPAGKVFIADGTRYLDTNGLVDFEICAAPNYYGAFTTAGAWWASSHAYGVAPGGVNWDGDPYQTYPAYNLQGENLALSYRHAARGRGTGAAMGNKGTINVLFFDGHVERLQDRASRRIDQWYPRGSTMNPNGDGPVQMTTVPENYVIR